jgi:hypothetical protein
MILIFSLASITKSNEEHHVEYTKINRAYEASQESLKKNLIDYPQMEKSYQFYQQCRAYVYSFLECYNEKVILQFKSISNNRHSRCFFFIKDDYY